MANEGTASVKIIGDVRDFARQVGREIDQALAKLRPDPVEVPVDADAARKAGEAAGEEAAEGFTKGADGRIRDSKGRFVKAGEAAGKDTGEGFVRGADGKLRDSKGRFVKSGKDAGDSAGDAAGKGFLLRLRIALGQVGGIIGNAFSKAGSKANPALKKLGSGIADVLGSVLSTALAAVGKTVALAFSAAFYSVAGGIIGPAIAAAITAALGVGLGAGLIGLAALALKEVKPLQKAFDGFTKTLREVGAEAAKPLLKPLTKALGGLSELALQLKPEFTSIFKALAPAIKPLNEALGRFLGSIVRGIKDSMPGIVAALDGFGRGIEYVGEVIGDLFRTIFANEDLIDNTTEGFIKLVTGPLKLLGPLISGLNVAFGVYNNLLNLMAEENVLGRIGDAILQFVDGGSGALGRITEAWGPLSEAIQNVWDKLKNFAAEDDMGKLSVRWQEVIQAFKEAWGPLKEFIGTVWEEALATVQRLWNEKFMPWWEGTARPWLEEQTRAAFEFAWDAAVAVVSGRLDQLVDRIGQSLGGLPARINGWLAGVTAAVARPFQQAFLNAVAAVTNGIAAIIRYLLGTPGRVRSALGGVRDAVVGAFSGASSWLWQAGANIISGLLSGIRAGFGRVRSLLGELTAMLPDWKGPAAVDKAILRESGRLVMQGFEAGLLDQQKAIRNALAGVTGSLPDMVGPTGYGSTSTTTVSGGLTFNINVSGASGQSAGEQAAEAVLARLVAAGIAR